MSSKCEGSTLAENVGVETAKNNTILECTRQRIPQAIQTSREQHLIRKAVLWK